MKNTLTLHEAIGKVLMIKKDKTAIYGEIACDIEEQNLYQNRKGSISLAKQIYLGSSIASSKYRGTWFEVVDDNSVRLIR
ncbi:hypothetical protein JHJ32_21935 [Parapedobacter sp. ISTM3]|nr:hypothetical protein [Parapedobacter sp. ISTM3]